eukprot:869665_1
MIKSHRIVRIICTSDNGTSCKRRYRSNSIFNTAHQHNHPINIKQIMHRNTIRRKKLSARIPNTNRECTHDVMQLKNNQNGSIKTNTKLHITSHTCSTKDVDDDHHKLYNKMLKLSHRVLLFFIIFPFYCDIHEFLVMDLHAQDTFIIRIYPD